VIQGSNVRCNHFLPKALIKLMIRSFRILSGGTAQQNQDVLLTGAHRAVGQYDGYEQVRQSLPEAYEKADNFQEGSTWRWRFS
jgi:hypothetical protein